MLRKGKEGHVRAERDVLMSASLVSSPGGAEWTVRFHYSFQDRDHLYLVRVAPSWSPSARFVGVRTRQMLPRTASQSRRQFVVKSRTIWPACRQRKRSDIRQLEVLQVKATYSLTAFPPPEERAALAKMLDISAWSVQNWSVHFFCRHLSHHL